MRNCCGAREVPDKLNEIYEVLLHCLCFKVRVSIENFIQHFDFKISKTETGNNALFAVVCLPSMLHYAAHSCGADCKHTMKYILF